MYEAFYGLHELPFRLTPDPHYLYLSAPHREALGHLIFGIREGSGFVAVTGEIGAGKTTLVRALLHELGPDTALGYVFNPALSDLELLQTINAELSLPADSTSKKVLIEDLNRFLLAQKAAGRRVVVIVDEAQALTSATLEQLRLLSNLETETEKLLQIVLVGQPELREVLQRPELEQLNQRITVRWHLEPLGLAESVQYLRHRLRIAGARPPGTPFTPAAERRIARHARGVPRLINIVAHHALLVGYTSEQRTIGRAIVRRAIRELERETGGSRMRPGLSRPAIAAGIAGAALTGLAAGAMLRSGEPPAPPERRAGPVAPAAAPGTPADATQVAVASAATPSQPRVAVALAPADEAFDPGPPAPEIDETVAVSALAEESDADLQALWETVAELDHRDAAIAATESLLAVWSAEPLRPEERATAALDLEAIARRRNLRYLPTSGTLSRLQLLNLPAILEISVPPTGLRRFVLLTGLAGQNPIVRLAAQSAMLTEREMNRLWLGEAHVLWRDFEALPTVLGPGSIGPEVGRLKQLLARVGEYRDDGSRLYDQSTAEATARFQRSHRLQPDGIVGPLTKIVLYDVLAGYDHPRLSGGT